MATYINGFGGSIQLGANTLCVTEWDCTITGEALDTTNTCSAGWEENILGVKAWEGTFKSFLDTSAIQTGAAGWTAGARGTISLEAGGSGKFYGGTCQITSIKISNPAKGVVAFDGAFKGSGPFTYAS